MNSSESIGSLAKALSQAQAEFSPIVKDKIVRTGKYDFKYAELDQIIEKTKPALTKHGLAVTQLVGTSTLTTMLIHESGEYVMEHCELPVGVHIQQLGSHITYLRRYAQVAILNVASEEEGRVGVREEGEEEEVPSRNDGADLISPAQIRELDELIPSTAALKTLLAYYKIKRLPDLPANDFDDCKKRLLSRAR